MKLKYDFNCEKCKNKDICKYYTETSKYCKRELDVKLKPKEEASKENLVISVNCKYYKTEETILNYPYGVKGLDINTVPYINTDINISGKNPFEAHFDPNSTTGSYPANTDITVSNNMESDKSINLEKSYNVIDRGDSVGYVIDPKAYACSEHLSAGNESSRNVSKIVTSKKHI